MPQIRVGLIGGGGIASAHISGYREHAEKIGITAVADAVEQTAVDRGGELGATPYTDYRLMLEAEDLFDPSTMGWRAPARPTPSTWSR